MNWEAIGAIGEVGGAIAVVITLFYLAGQVRQSNIHARRNEHNATMEQVSLLRISLAQDESLVDVYLKGLESYISLTPNEKVRFNSILGQQFWNYHQIWDRVRIGHMEEEYWTNLLPIIVRSNLVGGVLEWWCENNVQFPQSFVSDVDGARDNSA